MGFVYPKILKPSVLGLGLAAAILLMLIRFGDENQQFDVACEAAQFRRVSCFSFGSQCCGAPEADDLHEVVDSKRSVDSKLLTRRRSVSFAHEDVILEVESLKEFTKEQTHRSPRKQQEEAALAEQGALDAGKHRRFLLFCQSFPQKSSCERQASQEQGGVVSSQVMCHLSSENVGAKRVPSSCVREDKCFFDSKCVRDHDQGY